MAIKTLLTKWGEELNRECPLNDYPRPQLRRSNWQCLNGVWSYAITQSPDTPDKFDGEIIVPFSPECALSGVNRMLMPQQFLHYRREITFAMPKLNERLILHFGAVDQICTVYVNSREAVRHEGGYWPFEADITELIKSGINVVDVCVTDSSNLSNEGYGKQSLNRGGIWYTPQSGIWQTVWCEAVPESYIKSIKITPVFDSSRVDIALEVNGADNYCGGTITVLDGEQSVANGTFRFGKASLQIPSFKSWSPESPFLYGLKIRAGGDEVESYFGMRSFGTVIDKNGISCLTLNGKPVFHNGLLDQGYFSDGLYTPPSDEAMIYELSEVKKMGFNMLRKHIKIEPLRWYYHCDRLGLLVWQDFISGGGPYKSFYTQYAPFIGLNFKDTVYSRFGRADENGRNAFLRDMPRTVDLLYNCVSLSLWVLFNEGWGQFDAALLTKELKKLDSTRLIDHASGYHDQGAGHLHSYHVYYKPFIHFKDKHRRALALTEFGGYSLPVSGHMSSDKLFGYKIFKTGDRFKKAVKRLYRRDIIRHIKKGLCAAVYTQVSDVEDEINGIFTFDRKHKPGCEIFCEMNAEIYAEFSKRHE